MLLHFVSCEIVEQTPTTIKKKKCMVDLPYFSRFFILFLDPPSQQLRDHDASKSCQLRLALCSLTWECLSDLGAAQVVFHTISVSSVPNLAQAAAIPKLCTHPAIATASCRLSPIGFSWLILATLRSLSNCLCTKD